MGFEKPHNSLQPYYWLDWWWVVQLPGRRRWPKNLSLILRYSSLSAYSSFNLQNKLSSFLIRQLYGPYVVRANVLRLRPVLRAFFGPTVRTTPEIDPYVPHDSFNRTVLRPVGNAVRRHDRQTTHLFSPAQSHITYKVLRPARCSNTDFVLLNKEK